MTRYGAQFGPDFTFLGVPECDLDDEASYADADVVILGAPFDGGTSYRAGTRFGPQAIRMTDYLPHDGSRPSLALRADGLQDLKVYDAGDVEMYSGDIEVALPALEAAVQKVVQAGAIPVSLGGDHSIAYPDAKGCANVIGAGRVSMIHFDAHADTGDIEFGSLWGHGQPMRRLIESGALRGDRFLQIGLRGYWPPPETLDWMAAQQMRSYEMTEIVQRGLARLPDRGIQRSPPTTVTGCSFQSTLMCAIQAMHLARAPRSRAGCQRASCWTQCGGSVSSCRSSGWTSSRSAHRTTTPTSLRHWPIGWSSRVCLPSLVSAGISARVRGGIHCYRCSANGQPRSPRARSNHIITLTSAMIRRSDRRP